MKRHGAERIIVRRLRGGPRRSRVRVGLRVVLFFVLAALAAGGAAISLNLRLMDSLMALPGP